VRVKWRALAVGAALGQLACGPLESEPSDGPPGTPDLLVRRDDVPMTFADPDEECAECHETHVNEWSISNHAYAAKDPVFNAMLELGQEQTQGKLGQFCVQCHSPTGLAQGQTPVSFSEEEDRFVQDLTQLDAVAQRGVSCDVCHSITNVIEPLNARAVFTPDGTRRGTIVDPVPTPAHASTYSPLHASSDLCGTCHAVVSPKGALIEETFPEWAASSAAEAGKQCQDCHMPTYRGRAAPDAPERTLHRHFFVGVDVSLLDEEDFPGYWEMRELTAELLRGATRFSASANTDEKSIELSIENRAGHALPSGATAERQMWIEAVVTEAVSGQVRFESGTLDANGDIRDGIEGHSLSPRTDRQLIYFGQQLIRIPGLDNLSEDEKAVRREIADAECRPMGEGAVAIESDLERVTFPWEANWQCNYFIAADETARPYLDLSALPAGSYRARLKLNFRTFPPYFLRELEAAAGLDERVKTRVPTVVMAERTIDFTLPR
jgi:hypothetical protein